MIQSFATVGFGFSAFIIAFSLGSFLTITTGIPLLGGLLNGILVSMVLTIGLLSINKFGTATFMWLVFSIPAIITITLGPQGVYKVVLALAAGLIWDSVYFGLKKRKIGLYIGAILGAIAIMLLLIFALKLGLGKNASDALDRYMKIIYALFTINIIVTAIGVFLGDKIYNNRLSKIQLFQNLRS